MINDDESSPLLQCNITQIAGTDTTCSGTGILQVEPLDEITIRLVTSANPNTGIHWSGFTRFEASHRNTSVFIFSGIIGAGSATRYQTPMGATDSSESLQKRASNVIPMSGQVGHLHIRLSAAPGQSGCPGACVDNTMSFKLLLNGSGLSPNIRCTIKNPLTECTPDLEIADLTAGDELTVEIGGPRVPILSMGGGLKFVADSDLFMLAMQTQNAKRNNGNAFQPIACTTNCAEQNAESDAQTLSGPLNVSAIYVSFENAPGVADDGKKFDMTLSVDESTTALTCPILETAKVCNLSADVEVVNLQELSTLFVPTSTPTSTGGTMVSYAATVN